MNILALNRIFKEVESENFFDVVPEGTSSGDFLMLNGKPVVALTNRGDNGQDIVVNGVTYPISRGGVGLADDEASLAQNGTFEFPVTGALATTEQGTPVYFVAGSGGDPDTLSLTGSVLYGRVNYPKDYTFATGILPVRVGG